jgi:hypothetical protein
MRPVRQLFATLMVAGLALTTSSCDFAHVPTASLGGTPDLSAGDGPGNRPDIGGPGNQPEDGGLGYRPDPVIGSCAPAAGGSVTRTVGRQGGVIVLGSDTLLIPPGALHRPTAITASRPDQSPVRVIMLRPQGLRFHREAMLTMGYSDCDVRATGKLGIAEVTSDLQVIRGLRSRVHRKQQQVVADVQYVSNYAIAW